MTSSVRGWAAGVSLAGGAAVVAAMIGTASGPAAHADDLSTDIGAGCKLWQSVRPR